MGTPAPSGRSASAPPGRHRDAAPACGRGTSRRRHCSAPGDRRSGNARRATSTPWLRRRRARRWRPDQPALLDHAQRQRVAMLRTRIAAVFDRGEEAALAEPRSGRFESVLIDRAPTRRPAISRTNSRGMAYLGSRRIRGAGSFAPRMAQGESETAQGRNMRKLSHPIPHRFAQGTIISILFRTPV